MKVLLIDPWCSDNYEIYSIALCEELSKKVDLTLCSSYYESRKDEKYRILPTFFKFSDKMKRSLFRNIVRGLEYIAGYNKICKLIKKEKFDVVHLEWALLPPIDTYFMKKIRKIGVKKLVYTAHNAILHTDGEKHIEKFRRLQNCFDAVLVHGEKIKEEYLTFFPEDVDKVKIQRHGVHFIKQTDYNIENVASEIVDFVKEAKELSGKLAAFVGFIFYNKGPDRAIRYWLKNEVKSPNRLIVAGEYNNPYSELDDLKESIECRPEIFYLPRFLNDDELAFVFCESDLILMPYRHASMSGIVYTAAAFSKPIVYTNVGALPEYIMPEAGFQSENDEEKYKNLLKEVMAKPKAELEEVGKKHNEFIYTNFAWEGIVAKLVEEVYEV